MTTVYVVTKGEYSDYRIVACFSNREAADECVAILTKGQRYGVDAQVEEYELLATPARSDEYRYRVVFGRGYTAREYAEHAVVWGQASESVEDVVDDGTPVAVAAYATNPDRAKRAAQDRAAFLKARAAGIT
jgi:hypothetical protein